MVTALTVINSGISKRQGIKHRKWIQFIELNSKTAQMPTVIH